MEIHHLPDDAERYVTALAAELATTPDEDACVLCSAVSLLRRSGCDGSLRWVRRWPPVAALRRRRPQVGPALRPLGAPAALVTRAGWSHERGRGHHRTVRERAG